MLQEQGFTTYAIWGPIFFWGGQFIMTLVISEPILFFKN